MMRGENNREKTGKLREKTGKLENWRVALKSPD